MRKASVSLRIAQIPFKQLLRYLLTGVGNNSLMYLLYLLITHVGVAPRSAMTITYLTGACVGFVTNKKWTFSHRGDLSGTILRYGMIHLSGYFLSLVILTVFVECLGFAHQLVQAATIFVVAGFLFIGFKYFAFPADPEPTPDQRENVRFGRLFK